jgi:hypothetical protein
MMQNRVETIGMEGPPRRKEQEERGGKRGKKQGRKKTDRHSHPRLDHLPSILPDLPMNLRRPPDRVIVESTRRRVFLHDQPFEMTFFFRGGAVGVTVGTNEGISRGKGGGGGGRRCTR